jgi:hypothetical protein
MLMRYLAPDSMPEVAPDECPVCGSPIRFDEDGWVEYECLSRMKTFFSRPDQPAWPSPFSLIQSDYCELREEIHWLRMGSFGLFEPRPPRPEDGVDSALFSDYRGIGLQFDFSNGPVELSSLAMNGWQHLQDWPCLVSSGNEETNIQ